MVAEYEVRDEIERQNKIKEHEEMVKIENERLKIMKMRLDIRNSIGSFDMQELFDKYQRINDLEIKALGDELNSCKKEGDRRRLGN